MPLASESSSTIQTTGARLVVDALLTHGVERVFCVPGESFLAVLDSLHDETDRIQTIVCRHEAAAANMAEAVGKLTGRPGVAIVTRGPGATHASIGVHTAFQDSTPMILLIGQCAREHLDREAFQEIDYRRMFGQMAKWVAQIDDPKRIPEYLSHAFHTATSGRPGPVVLSLPEDVLSDRHASLRIRCAQFPALLANLFQRRTWCTRLLRHANLDHRRAVCFHRALECRQKIFGPFHCLAMRAERFCKCRKVRIRETGAVYAVRIMPFLMHPDRAEVVVVHHDKNHVQIVLHRRRKFLRRHHETTVTG